MINWILQKNLTKSEILVRIKSCLKAKDEIWEEVEVIPFSKELPEIKNKESFKIIYGSTTFMLNAYKDEELRAGVFYDSTKFQMKHYVEQWGEKVLNSGGELIKLGRLKQLKSELEEQWFIRPNEDSKEFSGRVATLRELQSWSERIFELKLPDLNEETEVWISEPKRIKKEWRLFVVDDEIISSSRYMKEGKLDTSSTDIPREMIAFAKELIRAYRLADIYVMDIAEIREGYKLIECNCFNGTGFYQHEIERIIESINNLIRRKIENK